MSNTLIINYISSITFQNVIAVQRYSQYIYICLARYIKSNTDLNILFIMHIASDEPLSELNKESLIMSATYEMTKWLQNCRFYQTIISNYLSEVK